jgi:cell division protein FtsI/penicillin-binding protein 2
MAAMALAVLAIYLVVLFNTQVVHHEEYLAKSIQTITRMENVEASRGIITDRSGRTLVTNQSTYSLTFDASLLKPGENQNDAILRLVTLCRDQGVAWEDNLPLSLDGAAHFTVDTLTDTQKSRFFSYLRDLKPTRELLAAYVRQHPELLKPPKEVETALDPATAEKVLELTKNIVAEKKITCLMVTHNMHQALELGNRTLMMDAGRIVFDVKGEARGKMTVDDLLEKFRENAGKALDNDRILLSKVEQ